MNWLQVVWQCDPEQCEALENALLAQGAVSLTYQDAADQPLLEPGVGEMPLWNRIRFSALFDADVDTACLLESLHAQLPFELPSPRVEIVERKDWERAWMDHYRAMRFGSRLWICPSWQSPPDRDAVTVLLDPGLAFGTGTHPTTALCLEWLDTAVLRNKRVIDYGCGSGVLGIAAALLGAAAVQSVDNDPQAVVSTRDNAARNGCQDILHASLARDWRGDEPGVDIILANILAGPLVELAPRLTGSLAIGGTVVLSGLLESQVEDVMAAYHPAVHFEPPRVVDGWVRLVGHLQNR